MTPKSPAQPVTAIRLEDLVPRENIKGGGNAKVIFGAGATEPVRKPKPRK
jgi:hypothetical protein